VSFILLQNILDTLAKSRILVEGLICRPKFNLSGRLPTNFCGAFTTGIPPGITGRESSIAVVSEKFTLFCCKFRKITLYLSHE